MFVFRNIANIVLNQDSNSSIEILPEPPNLNNYSPLAKRFVFHDNSRFSTLDRMKLNDNFPILEELVQ